jgi:hypothetical protein
MDDERLAALIRAGFEAEVLDLRPPEDLAGRVIERHRAAEGDAESRRGRSFGRVHFMVAAGALAATAAVVAVPIVAFGTARDGGHGSPGRHVASSSPTIPAYDPVPLLALGPLPKGWRIDPGGLTENTTKADRKRGKRSWSAYFGARRRDRQWIRLQVMTGGVSLAAARTQVTGLGRAVLSPVRVPAGVAEMARVPGADPLVVVVWQPRPGIVLNLAATGLAEGKVLAFVRGTSLRG